MTTPPPIAEREHHPAYEIGRLREHPRNPNQGDVGALASLIRRHGFRGTIEAQRSTGIIIAGNHRYKAARSLGMTHVPVDLVDVDDREALERLLADNRARDLAAYDDGALAELLTELAQDGTGQGLHGTGFDGDDLDELLADLNRDGGPELREAPSSFPAFGLDIDTQYRCPSCHYEWSGQPRPAHIGAADVDGDSD